MVYQRGFKLEVVIRIKFMHITPSPDRNVLSGTPLKGRIY